MKGQPQLRGFGFALERLRETFVCESSFRIQTAAAPADCLHPDLHPRIRIAKEMAAAAVLVATTVAVVIAALFLLR